jgi:hypothetical protein
MNAILEEKSDLEAIFPDGKVVKIPRADKSVEELLIMPLPFKKWKKGFEYIAVVAPMFGFNLFNSQEEKIDAAKILDMVDGAESIDTAALLAIPQVEDDATGMQQKIIAALQGEGSDKIIEFLAFAINKPVEWFDADDLYDAVIDITVAVIEVNINFFAQRLLQKVLTGTQQVVATAQNVRSMVKK